MIVVAADAAPGVGLGHLSRSSAVAAALAAEGIEVRALALDADGAVALDDVDWQPLPSARLAATLPAGATLVLDSYRMAREAATEIGSERPLVVFHDDGEPVPGAALVIAPAAESSAPGLLGGLEHACLRRDYWDLPAPGEPSVSAERVLVTTGGTDPGGLGAEIAAALAGEFPEVALVRGPDAQGDVPPGVRAVTGQASLAGELRRADLVVTAAGQTLLEAAAAGTPSIALAVAPNQRPGAERLARAGVTRLVDPPEAAAAVAAARELTGSADARGELARRARELVDGRGALRVAAAIVAQGHG